MYILLFIYLWLYFRVFTAGYGLFLVLRRSRGLLFVVEHGLSCPAACGDFLDTGIKPVSTTLAGRSLISGPYGGPGMAFSGVYLFF